MKHVTINLDFLFNELAANYFSSAQLSGYASSLEWEEVAYTNLASAYEDFKDSEQILKGTCHSLFLDTDKVKSLYRCIRKWRKRSNRSFPFDAHYNKIIRYIKEV